VESVNRRYATEPGLRNTTEIAKRDRALILRMTLYRPVLLAASRKRAASAEIRDDQKPDHAGSDTKTTDTGRREPRVPNRLHSAADDRCAATDLNAGGRKAPRRPRPEV